MVHDPDVPRAVGKRLHQPPVVLVAIVQWFQCRVAFGGQFQEKCRHPDAVIELESIDRPGGDRVVALRTDLRGIGGDHGCVAAEISHVRCGENDDARWSGQLANVAPLAVATLGRVTCPGCADRALPKKSVFAGFAQDVAAVLEPLGRFGVVLSARLRQLRRARARLWRAAALVNTGGRRVVQVPGRVAESFVRTSLCPAQYRRGQWRRRAAYWTVGNGLGHGRPPGGHAQILHRESRRQSRAGVLGALTPTETQRFGKNDRFNP